MIDGPIKRVILCNENWVILHYKYVIELKKK